MNWQRKLPRQLFMLLLVALLGWSITSCSKSPDGTSLVGLPKAGRSKLVEVSPPFVIQSLKPALEGYQPQVQILSPRSNQVLDDTELSVKVQVKDLPLYKDEALELGPYLQVVLDNQPYAQVYDTSEPLRITDLQPGTHTLRVFAVRPWHESFKNDGAFAQTSFHVFAKTANNQPDPAQPLLTYNAPQGEIGAEPVLLDFYLTNAPLHLVAREDAEDAIPDWQVRCTINGESFTFDRWEPIYLKGFKSGRNWVQLELLDDKGDPLPNTFNNVVQLITYAPGGEDALSRMTRGELTAEAARKIVDPNYVPPAPEPEVILEPDLTQEPEPGMMPPEVIAPVEEEPLKVIPDAPAPEFTAPKVEPKLEPPVDADSDEEAVEAAVEAEEEPSAPLAPIVAPTQVNPKASPFQIIIAPEGNAAPVEVKPVTQPVPPVMPRTPESEPLAEPVLPEITPEQVAPAADPLEAVKARLEEVFQPTPAQPETIPLPEELTIPEPAQPLEMDLAPVSQPSFSSLLDSLEPVPVGSPADETPLVQSTPEFSLQAPEIPNMVNALDRVKGFFENLRKRPDEPTLPLLLEDVKPFEEVKPPAIGESPLQPQS